MARAADIPPFRLEGPLVVDIEFKWPLMAEVLAYLPLFERTGHGWFQAHVYKFDAETSTFIVECPEHVWLAHGLDKLDADASVAFCEQVFARHLQGAALMTNARHLRGSAWLNLT